MKDELKKLYRKDKKLAIAVAQALGYKIKASKNIIDYVVSQKELADNFKNYDKQTKDLAIKVYMQLNKRLSLIPAEQEALNRLKSSVMNGSKWKEQMHRNSIFKAADSLKIKLPSSLF